MAQRGSRQVAQERQTQQTYARLLNEYQHPQLRLVPENSASPDDEWYEHVYDLARTVSQHEAAHIREDIAAHTERIRIENNRTQETVGRVLSHDEPLSAVTVEDAQTIRVTAPHRSHSAMVVGYCIRAALDEAINLYLLEYNHPPTHLRLSSYNHLIYCLEHKGELPTSHLKGNDAFQLIPDARMEDDTIICEEY